MGLGGHLMWTAVAASINKQENKKVLPIENGVLCDYSSIFKNNPNFTFNPDDNYYKLNISNPNLHYLIDHGSNVEFTTEKHAISHICEQLELKSFDLKCEIFLQQSEKKNAQKFLKELPKNYLCIEPYSKMSWSQGRFYDFNKWQNVVNKLKDKINFVQVGAGGQKPLDNVIDLSGKLSFRECSHILENSKLLLASEGGIVHLATCTNTKCVVVFTSFHTNPLVFHYPKNIMIDISLYKNKIAGYKNHELFANERAMHNEEEIIEETLNAL